MIAIKQPWPVIRTENHKRVFIQPRALHGAQNFANRPVDFFHYIAKKPGLAFAFKFS